MSIRTLLLLICLLGHYVVPVHGYTTMSDVERLIAVKMDNYTKLVRPKYNQSEPLYISMGLELLAIRDFDEVAGKFSVVGTVYMIWTDDRMEWDPNDYGGLKTFAAAHGDFWTPPLILVNAFDQYEKVGIGSYWPVRFYDFGLSVFYPGQVFTTTCSVDVELYPWDTQTCDLLFTVWGHPKDEVRLIPQTGYYKVALTRYNGNGEWDLEDTVARSLDDDEEFYQFQFKMKRKPLFIVVNILIPIIFMSVLNIMAFWIPIASGERLSYCITVLLALAVFLTLIGDTMPRSATTIAVLCYYLVCVLALSMLIIMTSIITMRIYHRGETERASPYWSTFVRCFRCKRRMKVHRQNNMNGANNTQTRISQIESNSSSRKYETGTATGFPENNINRIQPEKRMRNSEANQQHDMNIDLNETSSLGYDDENEFVTWKGVSSTLDIVFFVIAAITLASFTGIFFIYTFASK